MYSICSNNMLLTMLSRVTAARRRWRTVAGSRVGRSLKPGWFWTWLVILGELGGGLSVALGLLTPLGAAGMFGAMTMAIVRAHWKNGFFNGKRGIEFPLQLWAVAVAIGVMGPGDYSLDH